MSPKIFVTAVLNSREDLIGQIDKLPENNFGVAFKAKFLKNFKRAKGLIFSCSF